MKRRVLSFILIIFIILGGALAFFLTRPRIAVFEPEYPPGYDIDSPAWMTLSYRRVSDPGAASAVIALPGAELPEGVEGVTIGGSESSLPIDEKTMWKTVLSDGTECILYEASDQTARSIADSLLAVDGNAYEVTYDGRISVENIDRILDSVSGADKILLLTPLSSIRLIRNNSMDSTVVMDHRDAAAMETTDVDEAVSIDWESTIKSVLRDAPELSYTLITL